MFRRLRFAAALPLLLAPSLLLAAPASAGTRLSPETRARLVTLRDAVRAWAPIGPNGALCLKPLPNCEQGDMLEYSGLSCMSGDRARCEDVRRSQAPNGRFWRNPDAAVHGDPKNSFSRDMLMGVFDYVLVTRDKPALERFFKFIRGNKNRMCRDATDNRCQLVPSTWGLFSMVKGKVGASRALWERLAERTVDIDVFAAANTAPKGYQMQLVSHHLIVRRAMGQNTAAMRQAARRIATRQPLNPLFRYLHEGATEEAAALTQEICKPTRGSLAHDIFFQRELRRNAQGQIIVIRDWKDPVPPLASDVASGHDCLIVLNFLIGAGN